MAALSFTSESVQIKAAATGKTPTVDIVAYNGGIMRVEGYGAVVVDLAGLELPTAFPLAVDHDLSIDKTIGNGRASVVGGQRLLVAGMITSDNESARHVLELNRIKTPLQASLGADPLEKRFIPEGQSVQANGRNHVAPPGGFTYIARSQLIEVSIVTRGADTSTSVSIAAKAAMKAIALTFDEYIASLGLDAATLTPEATAALTKSYEAEHPTEAANSKVSAAAEITRINTIRGICGDRTGTADAAIRGNWSVARTSNVLKLEDERSGHRGPIQAMHHFHPKGYAPMECSEDKILEASLLLASGVSDKFVGKHYGEQVTNLATSKEHRGATLHHVVNASLRAAGRSHGWQKVGASVVADAIDTAKMVKAGGGFSTVNLPGILGNTAGKLLLAAYQSIPTTWQRFVGVQSATNFKPFNSYQFTMNGQLEELPPTGHLQHVTLAESEFPNKIGTRGAMIQLSRTEIINDDLGAFSAIPRNFARLCAVGLEKAVYKCLLANLGTIFTTQRGNYFEGNDSALSIASLGVAEQKFLDQVDDNGDPLLIVPTVLGVPTALSAASAVVCRDTSIQHPADIDTAESTGNPHSGKFVPFVAPWFGNANLAGHSSKAWYLFGRSEDCGVVNIAFLDGVQNPTIEEGDVDFSQLGMAWRMFFDFGVAVGDYRFGVRSKGES